MSEMTNRTESLLKTGLNRRSFLSATAAAGAGMVLAPNVLGQVSKDKPDELKVALLGAGAEGQVLWDAAARIDGIRFMAVCDIWEKKNLRRVSKQMQRLKKKGHVGNPYIDYKEMLDKEKDLDAVIVATPDFWHAEHTCACLEKGLHVYCEKEMSNTLEGARKMVQTARKTGKLLQIGHQRRSNPRYRFCYDNLIKDAGILGRITTISGQWNRSKGACEDNTWSEKYAIDTATLNKYGFKDMKQFRNWRWYKGLGGGPIVDLGSHQIDIYSWFLDAVPRSVIASGGTDYWTDHEWYDNVIAIYEFETKNGLVRASYQTTTTTGYGGYHEVFMGDEGSLKISEANSQGKVYRENGVAEEDWDKWVKKGYIKKPVKKEVPEKKANSVSDSRESKPPAEYDLGIGSLKVPYHQPHLENFFNAVRGKAQLNCPGEVAYETAAMVLRVNEAVAQQRRLEFKPDDFKA